MPDITIIQYEISPFSDKVRRTLNYKSLQYSVEEVLPSKSNKFKSASPTLKFPALRYDDKIIVDSTDIIRFIDKHHPEPKLIPSDPKSIALAHIIEDWADESLYYYDIAIRSKPNNVGLLVEDIARYETGLTRKLLGMLIPKGMKKTAYSQGLGRKSAALLMADIERHFAALEELLQDSEWLCSDHLSYADIAIASMLYVLIRAQEPAAVLPRYPKLVAWRQRVDALTL